MGASPIAILGAISSIVGIGSSLGLLGGEKTPKVPKVPDLIKETRPAVDKRRKQTLLSKRSGRGSTINTGALGLGDDGSQSSLPTILGT